MPNKPPHQKPFNNGNEQSNDTPKNVNRPLPAEEMLLDAMPANDIHANTPLLLQIELEPQETVEYLSPNQKAMRRLKKNKPAIFGLVVIILAIFIAIFAYLLVPDSTPNANNQTLEVALQEPGFSTSILKIRKNRPIEKRNIFGKILYGAEESFKEQPITDYRIAGNEIIYTPFTGSSLPSSPKSISLVDALYPLQAEPNIQQNGEAISFTKLNNERQTIQLTDLQQAAQNELFTKKTYLLGTDKYGRDNLSRLVLGVRISLSVGIMAVLISLFIGVTLGAVAGYFRGWVDDFIMLFINVFWSIPLLLLVFALVLSLGRSFWQIYLAVGLTMWVEVARIVRGQILSLREKEFVEAAQSMGFDNFRIIFKHILPNTVGPLVVITAANFATAIIIEAGLSFLGIGVQPPVPSWGSMLQEYYGYVGTSKAFLALIPGTAILILVLAFNLLGNGLRDALDVNTRA